MNQCEICGCNGTEVNAVNIVNEEAICDECLRETSQIAVEELQSYWQNELDRIKSK